MEEVEIDRKPYYLFGSSADCDFRLTALPARHQAALVHNTDGRIFVIHLYPVRFPSLHGMLTMLTIRETSGGYILALPLCFGLSDINYLPS